MGLLRSLEASGALVWASEGGLKAIYGFWALDLRGFYTGLRRAYIGFIIRALLFGVDIRTPDCWKLPFRELMPAPASSRDPPSGEDVRSPAQAFLYFAGSH